MRVEKTNGNSINEGKKLKVLELMKRNIEKKK